MLMQNFRSAVELGISEEQKSALEKTLVLFETGCLRHTPDYSFVSLNGKAFTGHFNMGAWSTEASCGTVRCIGGTAEIIGGVSFQGPNEPLYDLFFPYIISSSYWSDITDTQAARALRSYLNCGDSKWNEAVALEPNQMEGV